ncbi:PREDICTED: aspartic proteinase-like protein 1 [Erythranthe guttata]|uniref:aspartic proteinase-like protein 1 n=1 Tax=Erythranthe guttata TaxID=4155 RepID=UPI00064DE5CF|nr:PREDICTED: aspartic proteinase-like protein 1 [Erythranthe guttata]|eukprot:XP_012842939.1 PREDICTED: aspartic proteinase-like protein 1 [Erythranthe guttata]
MMICFRNSLVGSCLLLIAFSCCFNAKSIEAFGTFGFDIHHRYSDTVKEFLNTDGLPEKGTVDYYTAMAHRDHLFKGRRLAASTAILTFFGNNRTYNLWSLGFLQYSIVSVGTPSLKFLVALDTSSDLFWLPCDCPNCARYLNGTDGKKIELDIYSPSNSTTSKPLPCNSAKCGPTRGCSPTLNACSYHISKDNNTSTGILVDDILRFGTDTIPQDVVDVPITFGCGNNQTGYYLTHRGLNGVFGLGMDGISVPSVLANKGLTANSFSLLGSPTYNINVTQIVVGNNVTNLGFAANFDSGTATTRLTDPTYSFIVNNFNSRITEKRYYYPSGFILDYCYILSASQSTYTTPNLTFTMKGGSQFTVTVPTVRFEEKVGSVYCLALFKSEGINVIGQNFMTGYRLVFDREEMVLGWQESNCDSTSSKIIPQIRQRAPQQQQQQQPPPPPPNGVVRLSSMTSGLMAVILAVFSHNFIVLS